MEGKFTLYGPEQKRIEDHDILFLGLSRPELDGCLASRIRKQLGDNSKTKLVVCIDYAIELWQGVFNPHNLERELMAADMIFVSEPAMKSHVEAVLSDASGKPRKTVHHICHPTNIDALRTFYKAKSLRSDEVVALIHRYDNNWMAPYLATKDLPWNTHAVLLDPGLEQQIYAYFNYVRPGVEFLQYLDWVSRMKVLVDSYHRIHTYGRTAVDNACLQIPTVGADWTYAQKLLWPDLTVAAGDVFGQKKLIIKLMENEEFYDECCEKANDKVQEFDYENSRKKLLDKLYN